MRRRSFALARHAIIRRRAQSVNEATHFRSKESLPALEVCLASQFDRLARVFLPGAKED